MRCWVVRHPSSWETVGAPWRELLDTSPPTEHSQLEAWGRALWSADAEGISRCLVAEDCDGPVAILYFTLRRRSVAGGHLTRLANVWGGMVVSDGVVAERCDLRALWPHVLKAFADAGEPADFVSLTRLRTGSAFHRVATACSRRLLTESRYGGYSSVPTTVPADEWFGAASKNLRGSIRKAQNRLDREGGSRVAVATTPAEVGEAFDAYVDLEARGWKGAAGALANRPLEHTVLREFLVGAAATGQASVRALWVDDELAASHLCALAGSTQVLFKTSYNEEMAHLSPGNVLMADLVRSCCDDPAITAIDLVTDYSWHDRWKPEKHPTFRAQLFNRHRVGGLAAATGTRVVRLTRRSRGSPV
jgi:CelD/BcsL family acetyltransferase involved in cellulose biosynthesis